MSTRCWHGAQSIQFVMFREMHFLADMDQILAQIPAEDSERKNEINALTVQYNNRMLKQKPDKSVVKVNRYLKKETMKAVPFNKGAGFCLPTSEQYGERLTDILRGPQFLELPRQNEEPLIKSEKGGRK